MSHRPHGESCCCSEAGEFLCLIIRELIALKTDVRKIMASLQDVKDQLAQLQTDVETERQQAADRAAATTQQITDLTAEVQRLNDLIAAGGAVTAADLDGITASIAAIDTSVKAIVPDAA